MKRLLHTEDSEWSIAKISIAILLTFIFSISLRYIWVDQFQDVESFKWLGQLMINTNDGYYFAEGARDILAGGHQELDSSPINDPASQITALFAQILPFSFETIILWLPAFLGSLLVVPLILIGQTLRHPLMGVIAALVGSITWSYYNRTMIGYYDTDMLTIVLPTFIVWAIVSNVMYRENRFLLTAPIFTILYLFWYPQSLSLNLAIIGILFLYTLVFHRKDIFNYKLLSLLFIALLPFDIYLKFLGIFGLFALLTYFESNQFYRKSKIQNSGKDEVVILKADKEKNDIDLDKYIVATFIFLGVSLLLSGVFNPVISQLSSYVFREEASTVAEGGLLGSLQFYNVVQTVREASAIPFETFVNRISGHQITFWVSTLGVILMMMRYRIMLVSLPMIALGYLAHKNGLRFTVYAVPIYALGLGYLISIIVKDFQSHILRYIFATILTALAIYPNYKHIEEYRVPVVFNSNEVAVLDELKYMAEREDYVLSWWDYGYPIRYYSDVKTLVDGGQHSGSANYPVSYSLMRKPLESANMARLAVEYREMGRNHLAYMMEDRNISQPEQFLLSLENNTVQLPEKSRDIYYYLPLRMLDIFPTVGLFSQIDLNSGNQAITPFFYQTQNFSDNGTVIDMGGGVSFDKKTAMVKIGNIDRPIDSFYITQYDEKGVLRVHRLQSRAGANLSIIYMKSYGKMLLVDNFTLNSAYIQLFVLETAPKDLFEPVILTPVAKVYKLKK
jgi:dolichyl-diphosphooligosaccharide--protein glycosyltransferase/undecaprenyl-diphosphooligosaccharide--protein glycosyltransferase